MELKKCTKCELEQTLDNFYIRRSRNNQPKSICKHCESKQKAKPIGVIENIEFYDDEGNVYQEEWRGIVGYESTHQVSNAGRIKRIMHRKNPCNDLLNPSLHPNGYLYFAITTNGKAKSVSVHRTVAIAFIPNPENKPEVNHIGLRPDGKKGNKLDNRFFSLEWNTSLENIRDAWENGLATPKKGVSHSQNKLTEEDVLNIRELYKTKKVREISEIYTQVNEQAIWKIVKRKRWTHI
jgi:hypothetical protein